MTPRYAHKKIEITLSADNPKNKYPIGRKMWLFHEFDCRIDDSKQRLAISVCEFPFEFTCNSGSCVNITLRCNGIEDCNDGSDEYKCYRFTIRRTYDSAEPPGPGINEKSASMDIDIYARIIKINAIDTINMLVELTMEVYVTWHDGRLSFFNASHV